MTESGPTQRRTRSALLALLASGAVGFHLGYSRFFDWQIPVESAQVLAGIVKYPEQTPFYVHHMTLWTILHQVCALGLRAGISEIALSRALSGVLGMVSLQALAMFVYAFGGGWLYAAAVAVLLFVSGVTNAGAVYPIFLMGVPFTYGVIGLSFTVLTAALLGCGLRRTGAFLLGCAPAVHTGLAFWLWITVAACVLTDWKRSASLIPRGAFAAGVAVAAASYAVYAVMAAGVIAQPEAMDRQFLDAFVTFWDGHRRPLAFTELAVLLNAAGFVVATTCLRWRGAELGDAPRFLLRVVQISAILSIALVPFTWFPTRLPVPLLVLMPGRVVNTVALTFSAMLFGLLGGSRGRWANVVTLFLSAALLLGDASMLWRIAAGNRPHWLPPIPTDAVAFVAAAVLLAGIAAERRPSSQRDRAGVANGWTRPVVGLVTMLVLIAAAVVAYRAPERRADIYIDHTNNAVLARAAADRGLLLTIGEAHLMQLRVRRPMLIDTGALDTIPYAPGSGPKLFRILFDIYGIDLFHPPPEQRWAGRLLERVHRERWEQYRTSEWQEISRTYHVTQVLTTATWQLQLPIVAGDHRYLLYTIPE